MKIGILDSGVGGLAVAKYLKQDHHQIILIMDKAFFPYGCKNKMTLCKRAYFLCHYLIAEGVDIIVIACNTLSVVALDFLKANLSFPIMGVFDYLIPYLTADNLFIGSKHTIHYVQNHYEIEAYDGTELIEAIENNLPYQDFISRIHFNGKKKLILGCTHFLMLEEQAFPIETVNQLALLREDILKICYKKILI